MYLKNHVANRLLNDHVFWLEVAELQASVDKVNTSWIKDTLKRAVLGLPPETDKATPEDVGRLQFVSQPGKVYLVTNTVTDKLNLLRCRYTDKDQLDWRVFKSANIFTSTFILPNNEAMRIRDYDTHIMIMLMGFTAVNPKENSAHLDVHYVFIDKRIDYDACEHLQKDGYLRSRSEYIYKLMAFIYLSDVEEEVLKPGQSKGTKKSGKIINTLERDITIINSKWNVTTIYDGPISVSGYFAIRWIGKGRHQAHVVMVEPYQKKGYTRKAGKESLNK